MTKQRRVLNSEKTGCDWVSNATKGERCDVTLDVVNKKEVRCNKPADIVLHYGDSTLPMCFQCFEDSNTGEDKLKLGPNE